MKEILFRFVQREGGHGGNSAVRTDAWHHRSDAITSLAAAIGISVALIGGPGYEAADDVGGDGGRVRHCLERLAAAAAGLERIDGHRAQPRGDRPNPPAWPKRSRASARVEKCLVRKMGYQYYVDMHVEVDPQMTVQRSHKIAHDVKNKIRDADARRAATCWSISSRGKPAEESNAMNAELRSVVS